MSVFEETQKIIDEINLAKKQLTDNVKENFFTKLFEEFSDLNVVMIQGSTPSFNDGEPCYHSQDVFTGSYWTSYSEYKYYDFTDYEYYDEFGVGEDDEGNINAEDHINNKVPNDVLKEIKSQLNNMDDIFQDIYDTNFLITIKREEDGSVSVTEDEYDCGY